MQAKKDPFISEFYEVLWSLTGFSYYLIGLGDGHLRLGWGSDHYDNLVRRVDGAAQVLTPHIPQRGEVLKTKPHTKSFIRARLGI